MGVVMSKPFFALGCLQSSPRLGTMRSERLYKGRTSVERVTVPLKIFGGVDDGNVAGSRRFGTNTP